jgi:hypothetical protein
MEEMTMQLCIVQNDIQDILEAVHNPPGKRKRRGSNQKTEPTLPMNCRLANHKLRDASPEHSLMHSKHATTATQDMLNALKFKSPLPPLTITLSEVMPNPLPDSSTT